MTSSSVTVAGALWPGLHCGRCSHTSSASHDQRDFPLVSRPYAAIAEKIGASEDAVIAMLEALRDEGTISRIGPVFQFSVSGKF